MLLFFFFLKKRERICEGKFDPITIKSLGRTRPTVLGLYKFSCGRSRLFQLTFAMLPSLTIQPLFPLKQVNVVDPAFLLGILFFIHVFTTASKSRACIREAFKGSFWRSGGGSSRTNNNNTTT